MDKDSNTPSSSLAPSQTSSLGSPEETYQKLLLSGEIQPDPYQETAVKQLQKCFNDLIAAKPKKRFFFHSKPRPVKGVYIWGSVGRGKTWLADLLYDSLPMKEKAREHFHAFMQNIHRQLEQHGGRADPLPFIAAKLAKQIRVLFLDEFHVVDIGDAVILAQLLKGLFENGITLVTTSNVLPEKLYNDGIQRASFLPAIDLLESYTEVVNLDGKRDYRRETLEQLPVYLVDDDSVVEQQFQREFAQLTLGHDVEHDGQLTIASRNISFTRRAADVIWFEFKDLCLGPRNTADYLEIACSYHTLFLQHVPVLDGSRDDWARRFIQMVDVFYDHRLKMIISADAQPEQLYSGERLAFEFQRTVSRLLEMQSTEYLAAAHRILGEAVRKNTGEDHEQR